MRTKKQKLVDFEKDVLKVMQNNAERIKSEYEQEIQEWDAVIADQKRKIKKLRLKGRK